MVEYTGGETEGPWGGHTSLILPSANVGSALVSLAFCVTLRNSLLSSGLLTMMQI